ncbi:TLP18.3/Psb32/MOLO-1 phosphatase superfamily protein [Panacagrimonas perspica]|uniref:TLP18.3/Psb32/MOLO-1 phosphatase superfamily protein n=1 Tax=Panacagrimonas perspica TaxID=381431 RepID=A0A4S3K5V2_9GAMM|nr:TPM domain-containing protein [Panacagrimonas perspica]TDU28121.1 TLP18.3/Psb32/MOLO-1 phosphatase superfamily protein [Panacagrimonas perspica]THD03532.1 hypothetical protein B1810_09795 [Panacagrimonas perspica]
MRHALIGVVAGLLLLITNVAQAVAPVPRPTGYVTDLTQILEPAEVAKTQILLGKYEVTTGRKLAVLLVEATPDEELEAFADRVLSEWRMDSADKGGALLLWSAEGYILIRAAGPLAERLQGEAQADILSRWVVPAFGRGEAGVGIRQGAEQMIAVLDGGEVGLPSAEEVPVADALAAADAAVKAAQEAAAAAAAAAQGLDPAPEEPGADVDTQIALEPPMEMPPWFEKLPEDVARLAGGVTHSLTSGLDTWFGEAGEQAGQLTVLVPAMLLQIRGEQVEPPFHPVSVGAAYALAGLLALAALMLWGRAFTGALIVGALGGGVALWVATGFTALAGCLVLAGLLSPVLVPLLRALLRGANDSEREPMPTTFAHPGLAAQPRVAMRAGSAPRDRHVPRALTATVHSSSRRDRKAEELVDLIKAVIQIRLRQLKPMHGVMALVLVIISFPLALLALLVLLGILAYRDGIAFLLADLGIAEPELRERLKQHLPRPKIEGASGL